MVNGEKRAVISVYQKDGIVDFMSGLEEADWELFATSGTAKLYTGKTGLQVASLHDLVTEQVGPHNIHRELVAKEISRLIVRRQVAKIVCVNLRPPRFDTGLSAEEMWDQGGLTMIAAGRVAGAVVVTNPAQYEAVLDEVTHSSEIHPDFINWLHDEANDHVVEHLTTVAEGGN
jgi:AICAR transformylase/IMP cyclohydrolase PurH